MASHNTPASIGYQLAMADGSFVIKCLKLLWRAKLLNGHSATLRPVVDKAYKRQPLSHKEMTTVRRLLRQYHTEHLPRLLQEAEERA